MNTKHMRAYGNGALDGYNCGSNNNPYDPADQGEEHQAYMLGYDYGVTMYCQDNDDEQMEGVVAYFEAPAGAHEVATFCDEETYAACVPALEALAKAQGYVLTEGE